MKKSLLVAALLATGLIGTANADIKWNYVGAGYNDIGPDGPYVQGSFALSPNWVLTGDLTRLSEGQADFNRLQAGLTFLTGFRLDFSPTTQTYLRAAVEDFSGDVDETGGIFGLGVRHPLTPQVELYSEANHHTVADDYTSFEAGIAYFLSPDWAIRSNLALNNSGVKNEFRIGVSYQF